MDSAIEVCKAVVLLDRFPALAELDLSLPTGSVALIQGPNGAGKTTLLRLLAGLLPLESGSARVLGCDVATQRRIVRASVGLLGPNAMLYEDLSITENLTFWSRLRGEGSESIPAALERVGLSGLGDQAVRSLSTGQRRRASLAAVALRRPRLWLLDEPHAGLDQAGRSVVDDLVADSIAAGATVLVASHELDRVRPLATHVVTVAGGMVHRFAELAARSGPASDPGPDLQAAQTAQAAEAGGVAGAAAAAGVAGAAAAGAAASAAAGAAAPNGAGTAADGTDEGDGSEGVGHG